MMTGLLLIREAVASIAASHDATCDCTTCRAAAGDIDAMTLIMACAADMTVTVPRH